MLAGGLLAALNLAVTANTHSHVLIDEPELDQRKDLEPATRCSGA
jgi:hypothetical protein